MATFKASQADNYGGGSGAGFFKIDGDREVKRVRIMYNGIDDVEGMSVHKVKIGDSDRYVNCLRDYNDPVDKCPLCEAKKPIQARLFIPIYNIDEDQAQIWDRGKTMFAKMSSIASRFSNDQKPLVGTVFEIERNGKPKDTNTTYEFFNIDSDDTTLEDLPEAPTVLGKIVLDKTADEMRYYLRNGDFERTDNNSSSRSSRSEESSDLPVRRRGSERRTPASRSNEF